MKIGIDISQTAYKGTGVARYTIALLKGLMEYDKKNEYILFFSSLRQKTPAEIKKILNDKTFLKTVRLPPALLNLVWNKLHILPIENLIGTVDIFFSSDWVEPPSKAKKISTIHDLVPYKFPETSNNKTTFNLKSLTIGQNIVETQKKRLDWVKKESSIITCNSKTTKNDVKELLDIPESKLRVIYPGVDIEKPSKQLSIELQKKYKIDRPFVLTVGTLQPRKNIQRLLNAFSSAHINDLDLYVIGMQGWGEDVKHKSKNIKFLGYVPDEELSFFYEQALFFVYPALYEGFGFPIAEAMRIGCPVATSNSSSLKELADGYGLLFDPYSEESIAAAIHTLYTDSVLRKQLAEKSIKRAADFSIKQFADGFIKVFEELA